LKVNGEKYSYANHMDHRLLPGFERMMIPVKEGSVRTLIAGSGPPLLMLHGDPQTHLCWHKIAPQLTDKFTIVLTDIRGRGETHKPGISHDHRPYSKREMAIEQVDVMRHLGFERFLLIGHDRGARVARRMALDHPRAVERLVVMDIVPALDFYETANAAIAQDYYYFFFLTQPAPNPERLIGGDARGFMNEILMGLTKDDLPYDSGALEAYLQASTTSEAITAMCECFRAGLSCDCEDDRDDRAAGRKIKCPTLVLWGEKGIVGRYFDMREVWQRWTHSASFAPMPCGHFIPEEAAEISTNVISDFLAIS
jgi:haloacetate dehalogenase